MNEITFKDIKLNLDLKLCTVKGKPVHLSKKEFNLLEFFMSHTDKIYCRKEIILNVWEKDASLRAVDAAVSKLREKVDVLRKYLISRLGFGYGLVNELYPKKL